jgi:hypothetical protein
MRFSLPLETLAQSRSDLADLRIVDAESRQRPYLVESGADTVSRGLTIQEPISKNRQSRYVIDLPASPATLDEVALESDLPFFDREARLVATIDGDEVEIGRLRLVRQAGRRDPVRIRIPERRIEALELRVEDGDDAPLTFRAAEGRFPVPVVYFAAPAGSYSILAGYPDDEAPRYEIERVRDVVLTAAAGDAGLGELGVNQRYNIASRLGSEGGIEQVLLWVALALAVAALTFWTLRLARRDSAESD